MSDIFYGTSGPHDAPIVLVGEAWGIEESLAQKPFVGQSGMELTRILAEAGIDRSSLLLTNVVSARPQSNAMWRFFNEPPHRGTEPSSDCKCVRHLHPTGLVLSEMQRLYSQIHSYPRRLVIACGNYALWATSPHTGWDSPQDSCGRRVPTGISDWRGSMSYMLSGAFEEKRGPLSIRNEKSIKLLPIVHPAAIMRQWTLRAVTVHDLKMRVPQALADDWRRNPTPTFLAPPTFEQAEAVLWSWLNKSLYEPLPLVGDVETRSGLTTCVGLSDSPTFAISIPLVKPEGKSLVPYWTLPQEATLVRLLSKLAQRPLVKWIGQNFAYDVAYFEELLGTAPTSYDDIMLMHHLLFPGTPKALEYTSSLYCKYYWYWKADSKEWDLKEDLKSLLEYNCLDCINTFEDWQELSKIISSLGLTSLWEKRKAHLGLALRMMKRGVRVDDAERRRQGIELVTKRDEIYEWLSKMIPQEWVAEEWERVKGRPFKSQTPWYASGASEQQKILFRDVLGCAIPNNRKTGRPSLGKEALKALPKKYPMLVPLFDRLEATRSLDVFHSHFIQAKRDHRGRMVCSFNPAGTETFRFSSSTNPLGLGTNLQNVPEGTKDE